MYIQYTATQRACTASCATTPLFVILIVLLYGATETFLLAGLRGIQARATCVKCDAYSTREGFQACFGSRITEGWGEWDDRIKSFERKTEILPPRALLRHSLPMRGCPAASCHTTCRSSRTASTNKNMECAQETRLYHKDRWSKRTNSFNDLCEHILQMRVYFISNITRLLLAKQ